jgi:hypothetical protein
MDNINIKDHPPWYARGTPVTNPRDGPAMANHNILLFANPITIGCRGPSARGEPKGKNRLWLTLKKSILVDADRSGDAVRSGGNFDLSACEAPDNVKMKMEDNVKKKEMKIELFNNKF